MSVDEAPTHPVAPFGAICAMAWLVGAAFALSLRASPVAIALWIGLVVGLVAWGTPNRGRWLGAACVAFAWTGLQAAWSLQSQLPSAWEGREVIVNGRVEGLPEPQARRTRFLFRVDDVEGQPAPLRGRLVRVAWYDAHGATAVGPRAALRAGERWRLRVRVRAPRGLANPGGFDAERHAMAQRISATGYVSAQAPVLRLEAGTGIDAWRGRMAQRIQTEVPGASERFVRALALGDTRGLSQEDWQVLRAVGLTHLIAISGFHVGLVAGAFAAVGVVVWRLFPGVGRRLPRPQAVAWLACLGALGYAAAVGFGLPTLRTVLMIAVVVLARTSRRPARVTDALVLAMFAILVIDPLAVLMAGFWLSFAGVAWLAWCLPASLHWAKAFLPAQGVATLGLLPLSAVLFGQASLAGPFANLLAIPWWSLVVVPLALSGTLMDMVHTGAGSLAWRAAATCFDLTWPLFSWLADTRFALWWLPEPSAWALPLSLVGAFCLLLPRGMPGKVLASLLWLPLLWPDRERPPEGGVEVVVIDVGQGLGVLVRTTHHALLYDAGPAVEDGFDAGDHAVVPVLRALGVAHLDAIVVSHGDNDHAGGVAAVQAALPVDVVLAPGGSPTPSGAACLAGAAWRWDGVGFRFLHPPAHFPYFGNEASCVLRVESPGGAVLLPGDIGAQVESWLVRRQADLLRSQVVLLPHHGSAGSSTGAFVRAVGARLVVGSSGWGNRFHHPRREVVERWRDTGAEVLDTSSGGAVRIWLGASGLAVRERRHDRARLWDAVRRQRAGGLSYRSEDGRPDAPED